MRNTILIIIGILLGALGIVIGIQAVSKQTPQVQVINSPFIAATGERMSLSERQLRAAQDTIERAPADPKSYNLLCAAYLKGGRETGDFGFNARAEAALNRSLELSTSVENYDAIRLKATLLLTSHRFDEALEVARRAQTIRPQDPANYGAVTDALVELGDYRGAFAAAQKMMDLRPGTSSYARISYLRELQGDVKGAIEAMRAASEAASAGDPETGVWCRVHLGDLLIDAGELDPAIERRNDAVYKNTLFGRDDQLIETLNAGIKVGQHEGGGKSLEVRRFGYNLDHGGVSGGLKILVDDVQQNQATQGKQLRRWVDFNFSIDNLLNKRYFETQNYFESRLLTDTPVGMNSSGAFIYPSRIHGTPGYSIGVTTRLTFRFFGKE